MRYLVQPIVNLNGTGKNELLDQQIVVITAAEELIKAMTNAMPHPRDYQLQAPGTYEAARDAYLERIERVVALKNEIEGYTSTLAEGGRF